MIRRVVFAGGIQAKALAKAYRLDIAAERDEDVFFIPTEAMSREAAQRVVAAADMLITDVGEAGPTVPDGMPPPSAQRIGVPIVLGDFLWPFAGAPHPRNEGTPALKDGPYPASFGDGYLDQLAAQGVGEDEAVERYLALDVNTLVDLDAHFAHRMRVQAELDHLTGSEIASFVEEEFRSLNLFATMDRLRLPLFRHVAASVFGRMGIDPIRAASLLEAPFPPGAMPIHPSVLRHFNMAVPRPDHRYAILDEGFFSFEQYCRRYLRYEWNEELQAGLSLAETNPAAAIPILQAALERSPGSRAGQRALEEAERMVAETTRQAQPMALPPSGSGTSVAVGLPAPGQAYAASPAAAHPGTPALAPAGAQRAGQAVFGSAAAPHQDAPWRSLRQPNIAFPPADSASPVSSAPAEPQFATAGLSGLRFSPSNPDSTTPRTEAATALVSLVAPPSQSLASPALASLALPGAAVPSPTLPGPSLPGPLPDPPAPALPEPQSYVELPLSPVMVEAPSPSRMELSAAPGKYVPLAPDKDLIEVLPRMLPSSRGLSGLANIPFAAMPETMPPPPLRPVLPPELHPEQVPRTLVDKIFGRGKLG